MTLELLQNYWWLLASVLGGLLVFLLFVQGGQSMLLGCHDNMSRDLIVNSMGRKWELTFTTLVVFGGAMFASFPLFYSTSFGGAYWLWMLILFSFILQAVSYEYRNKMGNVYGTRTIRSCSSTVASAASFWAWQCPCSSSERISLSPRAIFLTILRP